MFSSKAPPSAFCGLLFVLLVSTGFTYSQPDLVPEIRLPASTDDLKSGWNPSIDFKFSGTLNSSNQVIGQQEGTTLTFGTSLNSQFIYLNAPHEWRQTLNITESLTRTAGRSFYSRNADEIKYENLYIHHIEDSNMAPFTRIAADSSIFKGVYQTEEAQIFTIKDSEGHTSTVQTSSLRLTDPWRPLTLKESLGALYNFLPGKKAKLEARIGFGAQQVFAENQLVVDDDKDTDAIEVEEIESFTQAGLETALSGQFKLNKQTTLTFSAEALIPYANSLDPEMKKRSPYELINTDFNIKLSTKLIESITLDYEFSAKSQPQIVDAYQVQQNLLLSFSQSLL